MGFAFADSADNTSSERVILTKDGVLLYRAEFLPTSAAGFSSPAMASAILDEVSIQVLIPVRFLSFEEVFLF